MHTIQQDILRRAMRMPEARFSELKSDEVDGNLFTYHLNQLIDQGYVEKLDKGYRLSEEGKKLVARWSSSTGQRREQPQILTVVVAQDGQGRQLLFRWNRQPNLGQVSFPHGMLHLGEGVAQAAQRELAEKTGLSGQLAFQGDLYLRSLSDGEVLAHQLFHVFTAKDLQGELISGHEGGEGFWGSVEDFAETQLVPGTWEVLDMLQAGRDGGRLVEVEVAV